MEAWTAGVKYDNCEDGNWFDKEKEATVLFYYTSEDSLSKLLQKMSSII